MSEYKLSWVMMICVVFHSTQQNNEQDLETAADFQKPLLPRVSLTGSWHLNQWWFWLGCLEPHNFGTSLIHWNLALCLRGIKRESTVLKWFVTSDWSAINRILASWSPEVCWCSWSATKTSDSALIGWTTISWYQKKQESRKQISRTGIILLSLLSTIYAKRFPFDVCRLCRNNEQLCINRPSCWDAYCILYHVKSRMSQHLMLLGRGKYDDTPSPKNDSTTHDTNLTFRGHTPEV